MKKKLLPLLALLLSLVILMTSCTLLDTLGELGLDLDFLKAAPKTAEELIERIDSEMTEVDSYELALSADMILSFEEIRATATIEGEILAAGLLSGDYYAYERLSAEISVPAIDLSETTTSLNAYSGGRAFLCSEENGVRTQALTSEMTKEEYLALRELMSESEMEDFPILDCTAKSLEAREDGTYLLTLSGYTATAVRSLEESMEMSDEMFGREICDLAVSLETAADFRLTKLIFTFVFEEDDAAVAPACSFTIEVKKYGDVTRKTDGLDATAYTEVSDLAVIYRIEHFLEEYEEGEENSFTLEMEQTITSAGEVVGSSFENDEVSFGKSVGGYYYVALCESSEANIELRYAGGEVTVRMDGEEATVEQTEEESREFVRGLINTCEYGADLVQGVTTLGDGTCRLTLASAYEEEIREFFETFNGTYASTEQTVTVTLSGDAVTRLESRVEGRGVIDGAHVTFIVESCNVFN